MNLEPAIKEYTKPIMNTQSIFDARRQTIHRWMPTASGYEVQQYADKLKDALASIDTDVKQAQIAIKEIKQRDLQRSRTIQLNKTEQLTTKEILKKFDIFLSLSTRKEEVIGHLKNVIADRKKTAKWVRRERSIFLWELRLRKIKAVKLPLIYKKIEDLHREDAEIVKIIKDHVEQINLHIERHHQINSEEYTLEIQVRKLNFENRSPYECLYPLPHIPHKMKETIQEQLTELKQTCVGLNNTNNN
jgi:hypothetical protein